MVSALYAEQEWVRAMSDLIDRQMVIDTIEEMQMPIMRSEWSSDQYKFSTLAEVREKILQLPSAQPTADDDLVSREAVKKWLELWDGYIDMDIVRRMQYRVIDIPSTQQERKRGKWIDNDKINFPQCSECGMWIDVMQQSGEMNYCPHCGADMRQMEDDNV